ncbi:hypothetical protein CMO96_00625 [Candidatus Woesebacteria bacterium]|nr:hypothetical protein [Candidatus Woesebacteria bacterium]
MVTSVEVDFGAKEIVDQLSSGYAWHIESKAFNFDDDRVRNGPLVPLIEAHLVFSRETWPTGQGRVAAFYDPYKWSRELMHILVGRVVRNDAGCLQYRGLRYSKRRNSIAQFDVWSQGLGTRSRPARSSFMPVLHFSRSLGIPDRLSSIDSLSTKFPS